VAIALVVVLVFASDRGRDPGVRLVTDLVVLGIVVGMGLVQWLTTRWAFDGATLRIEKGLIRRDHRQLPVTRIQAVDVVVPGMARVFGLAALRIRMAGAGRDTTLSYLAEPHAQALRDSLLAAHHGVDPSAPAPPELTLAHVSTPTLVGSVLFSGPTLILLAIVIGLSALGAAAPKTARAAVAVGFVYLLSLVTAVWRRFNQQFEFTVASAPDGLRIRRGLIGNTSESIPIRRVQAVRQVEPLLWRLFGWCRIEVSLAGAQSREGASGTRRVVKTLLPVGPVADATMLRTAVIGEVGVVPSPPPRRAALKAPLSYHFLRAGHDDLLAVAVTGRIRRVTSWVPLEKAQSVRRVQGPVQRRMGLATVRLDVAGRRSATFKNRDAEEADDLVRTLPGLARGARAVAPREPVLRPPPALLSVAGAGWFADPSGRHAGRYWDGIRWTDHVDDDGHASVDPL
jgi:putative membrane protein